MANTFKFGNGKWAVKDGYALAYNDENGNFKPLPFDFTRATSATRVNKEGLIEVVTNNKPRIDFLNDSNGALLLEPSRTNLVTYSEDFTQWSKSNSTVTSNSIDSPEGNQNAALINYSITSSNGYIRLAHTASQYIKVYVKYNDIQWLMCYGSGLGAGKFIDIKNGVIGGNVGSGANAEIYDAGNGWKRIHFYSSSANITQFSIYAAQSDGSYASITLSGGVYLWGAQAEAGSYATSYIPNFGTALGATRSAETCNGAGDVNTFNDSEGVLFAEIAALADDSLNKRISLSDGSTSNRVTIEQYSAPNTIVARLSSNNVQQAFLVASNIDKKQYNKIALSYAQNNVNLWVNGLNVGQDTTAAMPMGLSELAFDDGGGAEPFYGNTKQIQYYDSALNDSDLETLTSWVSFSDMATSQLYSVE